MPAAPQASPMTPKSTNGATWSRTSSKKSKSSVVSPPDTTKPTPASEPLSISSQPSWPSSECRQTLVLLRHKTSSAGRSSSTARTSWQAACEGIDQSFAHGCDRVLDVTLRAQGQILWVDGERVLQAAGTKGRGGARVGASVPPARA